MAYTSHGHHILGSKFKIRPSGLDVVSCGGPSKCTTCLDETDVTLEAIRYIDEVHNDDTLNKVRHALDSVGWFTAKQITEAIKAMQNEGIVFRERS